MRVLIVEDELRLADALGEILEDQKYNVEKVHNGNDGLDYAMSGQFDVAVLDIMLPGMNGFDVVRTLRNEKNPLPVILLTAKDELSDKITGLDCGADDYMTKPFAPEELLARIRALIRRQGEVVMDNLTFGDLTLDLSGNLLSCGVKSVHLGYKEFEVMRILMSRGGAIAPKEELIAKVWGTDSDAEDNNVEAYISFLRKKMFYLGSTVNIGTVRKVGYRLEAPEAAAAAEMGGQSGRMG